MVKEALKNSDAYYDKVDTVSGWARTVRKQGGEGNKLVFIELCDGTHIKGLQVSLISNPLDCCL